jgi:hypothetical protein
MSEAYYREIKFTDDDVINIDDAVWLKQFNPQHVKPWLLHDHGFVLAVVFAETTDDAMDEAANAGRLNRYQIDGEAYRSMTDEEREALTYLGNGGAPYAIEGMAIIELPNIQLSFCTLFSATHPHTIGEARRVIT